MKTIEVLENELKVAQKKRLIVSYEHIMNRDYLVVKLSEDCPESVKQKLKRYIKESYRCVSFVTTSGYPNRCYLYIKYNDDGC